LRIEAPRCKRVRGKRIFPRVFCNGGRIQEGGNSPSAKIQSRILAENRKSRFENRFSAHKCDRCNRNVNLHAHLGYVKRAENRSPTFVQGRGLGKMENKGLRKTPLWEDIAIILTIFTLWPSVLRRENLLSRFITVIALLLLVFIVVRRIRRFNSALNK